MADSLLGLFFEIDADPSKAVKAVSELESSIGRTMGVVNTAGVKTAQTLNIQATPAVARTGNELRQAQASAMIFEQQMGVHMPRAINAMLARSELIGPLLQGAFSVAIVALFAENIGKVIKSIADAGSALGGYGAGLQAVMAGSVKDSNEALTHFRGLTTEAKIATGYLLVAQTEMEITAVQARAAMLPLIAASKELQITWWQALLGPVGMAIGFGKAVKATTDTTAATKDLGALYNRLNQQISAVGVLQVELHKKQAQGAKEAAKDAKDASSEVESIIRLYNKLNIELTSDNSAYRTYLNTLVEINKIQDIHSRQVLGELNDQVLLKAITLDQTKLAKEEVEWRTKETATLKAETTEIKLFGGSWEKAVAQQMKIHPETLRLIQDMNLAGISMEKLRTEAIRVFGLGLPGQMNISKQALAKWANDAKLQFSGVEMAMVALKDTGTNAFSMFSQAMGMSIAQAVVYGTSIKEAMAQALKATLASLAGEALIRAINAAAYGFWCLATYQYPQAELAFQSAGLYGTIAGAEMAIGRAIPGGGQKVAGPTPYGVAGGTAGYATGVATGAAAERGTVIHVYIQGGIVSADTIDQVINRITDRVDNSGVVLHASMARRVEAKS